MRLIDAMAYRQVLEEEKNFTLDEDVNMGLEIAIADLVDAPTIEAEPVRHGRWELKNTCGPHTGKLHCSVCGKIPKSLCVEHYCPNCGAKMDGDKHDTEG